MSITHALSRNALSNSWFGLLCLALACASSAETPSKPKEASVRPGVNERFLAEDLDVEHFVKIFEGESREVFAQRERIVEALGVSSGMTVADIGAGTGLFLPAFDRGVGSEGRVYAVEISPRFLEHLRERAKREDLSRVEVVEALEDSAAATGEECVADKSEAVSDEADVTRGVAGKREDVEGEAEVGEGDDVTVG